MNKNELRAIEVMRKMYTQQGKSSQEIELLIGQLKDSWENSKAPQLVKSVPFVNSERLKELISSNDLETLKLLVGERDEARDAVKTASVESYVDAVIAAHEATMRVLNFSHQWVQCVETGLSLFKIGNRQYSIKERPNRLKIIGYRTEKEGMK